MTTIAPLSAQVFPNSGQADTVAAAPAAGRQTAGPAQPVTALSRSGSAQPSPVYSLPARAQIPVVMPVWESQAGDMVSLRMEANQDADTLAGRFDGLGAALMNQVGLGTDSLSQSVLLLAPGSASGASLKGLMQSQLHHWADNSISLSITTRTGAQVTLSLASQANGLAASIQVEGGRLTDADRNAIKQLADAFQGAVDGLAEVPPRLALGGLTQFDASSIVSVDLEASVKLGADDNVQTLSFHADDTQRSLSVRRPSGDIQVSVDMSNAAILGGTRQQAAAMDSYLAQFDAARMRGQGDEALMALFKDGFRELNSNYSSAQAGMQARRQGLSLSDTDRSVLSGLADFSASVRQGKTAANPLRPDEVDSFSYSVSQHSSVQGGSQTDYSLFQNRNASLKASYHTALYAGLSPRLTADKNSQNYYYNRIDDRASSTTTLAYRDGRLVKATLAQSAVQSSHLVKYEAGKLVSETQIPAQLFKSWDMTDLLSAIDENRDAQDPQVLAERERTISRLNALVLPEANPAALRAKGNGLPGLVEA